MKNSNSNNDFEDCKKEFKWFLDIQYPDLKGNINKQIKNFCYNFCFDDLYDLKKIDSLKISDSDKQKYLEYGYGSNSKYNWDCDDTHLARIIYFLIHNDDKDNKYAIPDLKNFTDIGSGYKYKYRGDTLNTYSTLFGSENQGVIKYFSRCSEKELEKIKEFRRKYVTIGNFMLLPAASVNLNPDEQKRVSINQYRGTNGKYKDFFDLFLYNFTKQLDFQQWKDEAKEYFAIMNNKDKFIEINMLEKYLDENTNQVVQNVFGHKNTKSPYCWRMDNLGSEYISFSLKYIDKATEIINYRANKIYTILKK